MREVAGGRLGVKGKGGEGHSRAGGGKGTV